MNQKIEDDTQKADDHILVCLSAAPSNLKIIDTAAKMANALQEIGRASCRERV